jgi:hypothetical protein
MPGQLPLSALLSQALVACIVECDNEFEHWMPHRTSHHARTGGQGTDGWRAKVRRPTTLPHYRMVLHRGGFPDGS